MGVWPPDNPDVVHRFPIRLWEFPDGLYVTSVREPNEDLAGARVLRVDGMPIDEVRTRIGPVVPRDTPSNFRDAWTVFLTSAEVLTGVGITDDVDTMVLDVETADGDRRSVTVESVDAATYADWVGGWELLLPERRGLDFLRDAQEPFRVDYLAHERTIDVHYHVVLEHSGGVVGAIRSAMRDRPVDRVVLDLRNNGGGDAGGFRELLRFLVDSDVPLVVLIGRLTFSAAATLAVELDRRVPEAGLHRRDDGRGARVLGRPRLGHAAVLRPGGARGQPVQPVADPRGPPRRGPAGPGGGTHGVRLLHGA